MSHKARISISLESFHTLVLDRSKSRAIGDELLPGSQGLVDNRVAGIQLLAAIVPSHIEELVVLEHLLLEGLGKSHLGENARVDTVGKLVVLGGRGGLGVDLLELLDDLCGCVVGGGAEDALAEQLFAVLEDALDELARVVCGAEERDGCLGGGGEVQGPAGLLGDGPAGQVGHEIASEEEGGRDAEFADVLLDLSLAVKVVDVGELSLGDCTIVSSGQSKADGRTYAW